MCGILGIFNRESEIKKQLKLLYNRGKDGFGISDGTDVFYSDKLAKLKIPKGNVLAHTLHSIVGDKVKQPFLGKGVLVANCEIYNWKELAKKENMQSQNDAILLFNLLEKYSVKKVLEMLDGVYSFAYWRDNKLYLARDLIGEKPLFYHHDKGLVFASEKKVLELSAEHHEIKELNPRLYFEYDIEKNTIKEYERKFFEITPIITQSEEKIIDKVSDLLIKSIEKRIPDQKFGIMFSGGIDSTIIAFIAKRLKKDFVCYTSALEAGNFEEPTDLIFSKRISKQYDFPLKIATLDLDQVKERLKIVLPLIESSNVVKSGVGLTMFAACEKAQKDKVRVIFSGIGSEEIFAGYERHKMTSDVNKECLAGLRKLYERDTYRDDVITMYNDMELRCPFLDYDLIKYSLRIPTKLKINDGFSKLILRKACEKLGLDHEFSYRKKVAAQYGSKIDKAIQKLSGQKKKAEYLRQFYSRENQKLAALWSGGKDSAYAAYTMKNMNYDVTCLVAIKSKNPDSYMFHTPNIDLVEAHAECMNVPIIVQETAGEKEIELEDLKTAIIRAKKEFDIDGVITGALYSNYQRERIEKICEELGLKVFSPLWHIDQELEMRSVLKNNFDFVFGSVAAEGLDKSWVGRIITNKDVDNLSQLNEKIGLNIAGEGGEFETLVLDCPMFSKKIIIEDKTITTEGENIARMTVNKFKIVDKA